MENGLCVASLQIAGWAFAANQGGDCGLGKDSNCGERFGCDLGDRSCWIKCEE